MRKILWCMLFVGLLVIGCEFEGKALDIEKTEEILNINKIIVDTTSIDVKIIQEDREDVKAHLYGQVEDSLNYKLAVEAKGNNLYIITKIRKGIKIRYGFVNLDIYVPKNYKDGLKIDGTSCDIIIKDMDLTNLDISITSGDTRIGNLNINDFEYESSSGDLRGDNIKTKLLNYDVSSGDIKIENFKGNIEGKNTSGDIFIRYNKYDDFDNDIILEASSGDITIYLPNNAEFYLNARVTSGDIYCKYPIQIYGKIDDDKLEGKVVSDKNKIKIETTSGDIEIK